MPTEERKPNCTCWPMLTQIDPYCPLHAVLDLRDHNAIMLRIKTLNGVYALRHLEPPDPLVKISDVTSGPHVTPEGERRLDELEGGTRE